MFKKNTTILFQGDSITDAGRSRDKNCSHLMGQGYVFLVTAQLTAELADRNLLFLNRGCSANKIIDLQARWKKDAINLKPDVISIMIGVNDVAAFLAGDDNFSADQYEKVYRQLLKNTLTKLPDVRFIFCDPFVLPVGQRKDNWPDWKSEIDKRIEIVGRLASEFHAVRVRSQEVLNEACNRASADYWLWDGIHPMPPGHELLAQAWISAVNKHLGTGS